MNSSRLRPATGLHSNGMFKIILFERRDASSRSREVSLKNNEARKSSFYSNERSISSVIGMGAHPCADGAEDLARAGGVDRAL